MSSRRRLTLLDLTCLGVNGIVGSSIFLFPGRLAAALGPASIAALGLTGLALVVVGLCFAEAASRFDRAGGSYLYARAAFGAETGFAVGWLCWVTQVFGWAAVADGIAVYLGYWGFGGPGLIKGVGAGVIVVLGALNYRGVKLGAWTSNLFAAAKLVPLLLVVAAGLPKLHRAALTPLAPHGWEPLGGACFLAYFAFQGFEGVPVPSGEAADPRRDVPIAVVGSLAFAAVFYMLVQAVALAAVPGLAVSSRPLADAAAVLLGPWGAALLVAGAACSMTGYNAWAALVAPRYLSALSEDDQLPGWLSEPHPAFGTPHRAVLATTGLTLAAALAFDFHKLVDLSNVAVTAQYLATCAAVPLLRRAAPGEDALRLPGGALIPAAGVAVTAWLLLQSGRVELAWSAALLVLGFILRQAHLAGARPLGNLVQSLL